MDCERGDGWDGKNECSNRVRQAGIQASVGGPGTSEGQGSGISVTDAAPPRSLAEPGGGRRVGTGSVSPLRVLVARLWGRLVRSSTNYTNSDITLCARAVASATVTAELLDGQTAKSSAIFDVIVVGPDAEFNPNPKKRAGQQLQQIRVPWVRIGARQKRNECADEHLFGQRTVQWGSAQCW